MVNRDYRNKKRTPRQRTSTHEADLTDKNLHTDQLLSLTLKKVTEFGADGSPLSVLGKSKVLLENKLKFAKTSVYVIKGLQCNLVRLR